MIAVNTHDAKRVSERATGVAMATHAKTHEGGTRTVGRQGGAPRRQRKRLDRRRRGSGWKPAKSPIPAMDRLGTTFGPLPDHDEVREQAARVRKQGYEVAV